MLGTTNYTEGLANLIDNFALVLIHILIVTALLRIQSRPELDHEISVPADGDPEAPPRKLNPREVRRQRARAEARDA